ncbi:MAG: MoxR family ATPase [Hydrogenophilaceae bacterium]|nr:MoxR family ATPase [Hydrogenophilaceae bacterium]
MQQQAKILELRHALEAVIVGQAGLLDRLVVGLLAGGHVLVEGLPGLAKTTAVKTLAAGIHARFQRIQFTPDLLPGDLTGTDIYRPQEGSFHFAEGPLFNEIILADEINRAPAKVQSALLEAMQEHQITAGGATRKLPPLFMVMATQNPIEQAGTYPLPEAQLDRFLLHVMLDYPSADEELEILRRDRARHPTEGQGPIAPVLDVATALAAREEVRQVHIAPEVEQYMVDLARASRAPGAWRPEWAEAVEVGASPRAALALSHASSALAYLRGRDYVTPDDVREIAPDCLRHRIILSLNARLQKLSRDSLIAGLLDAIPAP